MKLKFGLSAYNRQFASDPEIVLRNRFFEKDPTNDDQTTLLSRPGTVLETSVGPGPIQNLYTLKGLFNGALFIYSGGSIYFRNVPPTSVNTQIVGAVDPNTTPRSAGVIGAGYQRMFVVDGTTTQYYGGQQYDAIYSITAGSPTADTVTIDAIVYKFSVGAPADGAGTAGSPYNVFVNGSVANALTNLRKAINATGVAGTDYSLSLVQNLRTEASANSGTTVTARGRVGGAPSPTIIVSNTNVGATAAWNHSPLAAGAQTMYGVATPNNVGMADVAVLKSFVLFLQANSQQIWFIRPGNTTINGLDFFNAESQPDNVNALLVVGDQIWLLGDGTVEPWYATGDANAPFLPVGGRPISRGARPGTAVVLQNGVVLVGDDKQVYRLTDNPEVVSTNGIAERVRKAIEAGAA